MFERRIVQDAVQSFSDGNRSQIVWVDVADESIQPKFAKCPISQSASGFGRISIAFMLLIQLPTQFAFREQRSGIDFHYADTFASGAKFNAQSPMAKQRPKCSFMAENAPCLPDIKWPTHTSRTRRRHQFSELPKVIRNNGTESKTFRKQCGRRRLHGLWLAFTGIQHKGSGVRVASQFELWT